MLTILPQEPPESGWWLARLGAGAASKVGLVPGTYLQRVATPTAATPPPPPPQAPPPGGVAEVSGGIALALADFSAEEGEELSVALGDMRPNSRTGERKEQRTRGRCGLTVISQ